MLTVVFFGMELRILAALLQCPVFIAGVYLPRAPYAVHRLVSPVLKNKPRFLGKILKRAALFQPLAGYIKENGLKSIQGLDVNSRDFIRKIKKEDPDLCIVANFGQILGPGLLDIPKYGFINFHPSILPDYRGPYPLGDILLNQETFSGATWHRVTKVVDGGDILAQETFQVLPAYTLKDLEDRSVASGIKMLKPLLVNIERGNALGRPQDHTKATYGSKLTDEKKKALIALGRR